MRREARERALEAFKNKGPKGPKKKAKKGAVGEATAEEGANTGAEDMQVEPVEDVTVPLDLSPAAAAEEEPLVVTKIEFLTMATGSSILMWSVMG